MKYILCTFLFLITVIAFAESNKVPTKVGTLVTEDDNFIVYEETNSEGHLIRVTDKKGVLQNTIGGEGAGFSILGVSSNPSCISIRYQDGKTEGPSNTSISVAHTFLVGGKTFNAFSTESQESNDGTDRTETTFRVIRGRLFQTDMLTYSYSTRVMITVREILPLNKVELIGQFVFENVSGVKFGKVFQVNGNRVNLRTSPELSNNVKFQLNDGEQLQIINIDPRPTKIDGVESFWFYINTNGKYGWIWGQYLR